MYLRSMSRDSSLIDKITQQVREGLEERFSSYTERGHSLEGIGQPEDVARRMLATVPSPPSRWTRPIRPFFSGNQVARILGGISGRRWRTAGSVAPSWG